MSCHRNAQNIPTSTDHTLAGSLNTEPIISLTTHPSSQVDTLVYNGGPIPESVRRSYLQQKLPVRKQSLLAYGRNRSTQHSHQKIPVRRVGSSLRHPPPDKLVRALTIGAAIPTPPTSNASPALLNNGHKTPTRSATVTLPTSSTSPTVPTCTTPLSSLRPSTDTSSNVNYPHTMTSTNSLHNSLPTIRSSTSSMVTAPLYLSPSPTSVELANKCLTSNDKGDIEDDFNFGDRPPSTIDCTQPTASVTSLYALSTPTPPRTISALQLNGKDTATDTTTQQPIGLTKRCCVGDEDDDDDDEDAYDSTVSSPLSPTMNDGEPLWKKGGSEIETVGAGSSTIPGDNEHGPTDQPTTLDALSDRARQQLQRQKSQRSYYTPALSPLLSKQPAQMIDSNMPLRSTPRAVSLRTTPFYPALLSHTAQELYRRLPVRTLRKDDIEYPMSFNGKEAVDCLLRILRTSDRNLGLLIGRALDHQRFFHDVTYEHHLRDSQDKLYQFKHRRYSDLVKALDLHASLEDDLDGKSLPNGVFALLTKCYSPTCARDRGCYSVYCPRKGKKPTKRSFSQTNLLEMEQKSKLWIHSVPKTIVDATSREEIKRQECIHELIYTEGDFVEDLHYMHKFWVKPLITQCIIPDERREHFVQEVFWNMADIEKVNVALSQALTALQNEQHIVKSIGGVLLDHVCHFDPFVSYGSHQMIGKFKLELEKKRNPQFVRFAQITERRPESRRLELNGFLIKPITRLGKYNLLLREILQRTPKENPDYEAIPKVMETIASYLAQMNTETGKCENIFNLQQIEERLLFKSALDYVDLALRDPQRQVILQGRMKRKGNSSSETSDLHVFLFDHYLVFAKIKFVDHLEYYKVYRKPIPLDLLTISTAASNTRAKRASTLLAYSRTSVGNMASQAAAIPRASTSDSLLPNKPTASSSITFYHHGRKGAPPMTLYTPTPVSRKTWMERIHQQQATLSANRAVFAVRPLINRQFLTSNRIYDSIVVSGKATKAAQVEGNDRISNTGDTVNGTTNTVLLVGTDLGVYIKSNSSSSRNRQWEDSDDDGDDQAILKRVIHLDRITQMEVMDNSQLLVLADKTLWTFPLDDLLESFDKPLSLKKGRIISTGTAFFHVGECLDKVLVFIVRPNTLSTTTIRVMEPIATDDSKKIKSGFSIRRLVRNAPAGLKSYKDLYLPSEASSIHLLKSKMCISCPREIGVVDMKSFGVQALLDPADNELAFVFSRQDIRPISIYRVQFAEYLVCYNEFGFYVDQRGRWIRSSHIMEWEGEPDAFALSYPYLLAFEPGFIEIRNILSGKVEQLILGKNIRCTNSRKETIQGSMAEPDNDGYQVIFQLDRL